MWPWVPACEPVNLSQLRPHPEEPERSEGVSKDGRESELAAMVRDGALRAPPHHEAERVELVLNRQDLKDSQPLPRGRTGSPDADPTACRATTSCRRPSVTSCVTDAAPSSFADNSIETITFRHFRTRARCRCGSRNRKS